MEVNGDAVWNKLSVHYRQGGRGTEVVVKRGSTVLWTPDSVNENQTQLLKLIEAVPYRLVLELYFPFPHNRRTNTASKMPLIWTINL